MSEEVGPYDDIEPLRDAKAQRLLNLVMLLRSNRRGFTRAEIYAANPGYGGANPETVNTMFERDKRELQEAGISISGYQADAYSQDEYRYFIDDGELMLPRMDFTAGEVAALSAALDIWQRSALGEQAQQARFKLESLGAAMQDAPVAVDLQVNPAVDVVLRAIGARRVVEFGYLKPGQSEPEVRRVQPWGVLSRRGQWFLYGLDEARRAERVFNLSRLFGKLQPRGAAGAYDIPGDIDLEKLFQLPAAKEPGVAVQLRIAAGKGRHWRQRAGSAAAMEMEAGDFEVELLNPAIEVPRLAADSPGVVVLGPPEIRARVAGLVRGGQ